MAEVIDNRTSGTRVIDGDAALRPAGREISESTMHCASHEVRTGAEACLLDRLASQDNHILSTRGISL